MTAAFVALGSNLGDPPRQLARARAALAALPRTELEACSSWHRNPAIGPGRQPDYLNGAARLETRLPPRALLSALQGIEAAQGRRRAPGQRWQARTLDLDILLYGDLQLREDGLSIPHPRMAERAFVLRPLHELAPDLILPCGTALAELAAACSENEMQRVNSNPLPPASSPLKGGREQRCPLLN